jgi:DNA polymerase-3 subunit epsilon
MKMCADIADVSFETTGSELVAMLKESFEIKKYKPLYNRRQRRSIFRYGLKTFTDQKGYIRLSLIKTDDDPDTPLACFTTKAEALSYIAYIIDRYKLCQKLCGRYPTNDHCFHYEIGACSGACIGKESPEIYNRRVLAFINNGGLRLENVLIIDEGRNTDEKSVIKINNGKYIGYGFFSSLFLQENPELMHECITEQPDNREVQQIIKRYLVNNKVEKLMEY